MAPPLLWAKVLVLFALNWGLGASGTLKHLRNVTETIVGDVEEAVKKDLTLGQQEDPCSNSILGLGTQWPSKHPYSFPQTTCNVQKALGIVKPMPGQPSEIEKLKGILHHQNLAQPGHIGPAYAFTFIKNATSGGPFEVIPEFPPHGEATPHRRRLAETAGSTVGSGAALVTTPLDSVVTTGSVAIYTPATPGFIDANDFQNMFFSTYRNTAITKLTIPTGTYRTTNTVYNFNLFVTCYGFVRSNFELDWGGSTIIFTNGESGGVFFAFCYNLTSYNATFYYDFSVNPWYQATVDSISADQLTWNITVQDGYPTYFVTDSYQALCVAWDPDTRLPIKNGSDIYPQQGQTTSIGGRSFQFKFNYQVVGTSVGNFITCRGNRGNHGILPWYSSDSTFRDFTIYNAAIFAFYEETGTRNTYINNRVVPYPGAVGSGGAREAPLQSALADGFHAGSAFHGPTLIGNTFLNMGDDGIAIHGHFYLVVGTDKAQGVITVATVCGYACERLYAGNSLLGYTSATQRLGFAKMINVNKLASSPLPPGTTSNTFPYANLDGSGYLNITLACWPSAFDNLTFDSVVTSLDNQGNGFKLINNTISYNRGRGMLLKANDGTITGNTIIQPKFIAAQITPEFFFQEADFSSNLLIDSNVFDSFFGGIELAFIFDGSPPTVGQFQNHANITISNNIIRNAADQPLLITSSTNVAVLNNTFDSVLCYPYTYGAALPFVPTPQPPVYVAYSSHLQFSGNSYIVPADCTYGNFTVPIQASAGTVTDLVIQ